MREQVVFPLEEHPVLRGYEEFTDVPENRLIKVYSLEEIATEKLIALADRARTEPRDLYDFWYLTSNENISLDHVSDAIRQKLKFRNKSLDGFQDSIQQKEARLKALWSTRLAHQMRSLPQFDDVFRAMRRSLRRLNLS